MTDNRTFPADVVLSAVSGVLLCERGFGAVHELLEWMAGGPTWTHQLPRVSKEAALVIVAMHQAMQAVTDEAKEVTPENWREWLDRWIDRYGPEIEVPRMTADQHEQIDPLSELAEKVHPDKIAVVHPSTRTKPA